MAVACGVVRTVAAAEIGIRDLQRETSRLLARVEDGEAMIVTRYGRPVALLLPAAFSAAWVLAHRPLDRYDQFEEAAAWPVEGGVRIAPAAEEGMEELRGGSIRARLLRDARRLRAFGAVGRVAIKIGMGQRWALIELNGAREPPALLDVRTRKALERYPM